MFRFLCKSIPSSNVTQLFKLYSTSLKKAEKSISLRNGAQDSFTVQYLMSTCGFSMEKAVLSSCKYVKFDKPDQPDSVISFLTQGFTDSQIQKLVASCPPILSSHPQNTLLPKFQFFRSKGFSTRDLAKMVVFMPTSLKRSMENCIVPSFNFISDFLASQKDVIWTVSKDVRILLQLESRVKPNIEILIGAGMSRFALARLMSSRPQLFVKDSNRLKESIKQVENMKMDPESYSYGLALWILTASCRSNWGKKKEAFKRWGCSEDDVLTSFKIFPHIMVLSEEKLKGIMNLFVHDIGWKSSEVVKSYFMFTLSLNKRLIPRWSVYKELLSEGLLKNVNLRTMFQMKEDQFLKMFVNCYKHEAPSLLTLYIEKKKVNVLPGDIEVT